MSDQEKWVSLPQAVAIVKAAIDVSLGPAQRTLIALCESGDVRARWTSHYLGAQPAIHRQHWIGADIDWRNFRVVKADGNGMTGVDFSEEDLNVWVALQSPPQAKVGGARHFTPRSRRTFVAKFLANDPDATLDGVRDAAREAGYVGNRDLIDSEYRAQKSARGDVVRRGRRTIAKK